MKIRKQDLLLLTEQGFFSGFNFFLVISLFHDLNAKEIAAYGVNFTALYGGISILRNIIVGDFFNSKDFLLSREFSPSVDLVIVRTAILSPVIFISLLASSSLLGLDKQGVFDFAVIGIFVLFIDSIRQVSILYSKFFYLILSFFSSSICAFFVCFSISNSSVFFFWILQSFIYVGGFLSFHIFANTRKDKHHKFIYFSKFGSLIFLDAFFNHLFFYIYNFLFFRFCLEIAADMRLINIYIINLASTIYTNLNSTYAIRLLHRDSSKTEQRRLDYICFFSLFISSISALMLQRVGLLLNLNLSIVLLVGTCLASSFYFIHSRLTIYYVNLMSSGLFLLFKILTWCFSLGVILGFTKIGGAMGLFMASIFVNLFVLVLFEIALKKSVFYSKTRVVQADTV